MPAAGKGKDKEQKPRRKPGRVPTSCAECRRLKLRCDRNIPCEKCVSRGCGSICPDGALTPGKGNRMILANTEELHDRIDHLTSRVRELETALQTCHSQVSGEPHPLLQKDTFQNLHLSPLSSRPSTTSSPDPPRTPRATSKVRSPSACAPAPMDADPANMANSSGTLVVHANGQSSFFGSTARSEFLTYKPAKLEMGPSRLSNELIALACPDPRAPEGKLGNEIFSFRPQFHEAFRLCELYLENGKVMYSPVPRPELIDKILVTVYYHAESCSDLRQPETLALLFIVFAISTHFDHSSRGTKHESSEYYYLARACLRLFARRENTLTYLQTLIHMVQYLDFCGTESTPETQMELIGQAIRIGYKMGLHLHGIRWNLPDDLAQRRARIFCELFLLDTWTSFNTGRPPTMSLAFMDRTTPKDYDEGIGADGNTKPGFHTWTYKYAILLHSVMAIAFGPKPPSYKSVLDLDLKVRNFAVPVNWRPVCDQEASLPPDIAMIHFLVVFAKECTLLSLHRNYFIQALEECPEDLSKHQFIPSVLAIYRSALRLIRGLRFTWAAVPKLISKVTMAWSQAFSAAIVMCLFAVRTPRSHLTDPALVELDLVIGLFEEAAPTCRAANDLLSDLKSLRRLARASAGRTYKDEGYPLESSDLDRLAGKTHLLDLSGSGSPTSISFASSSSGTSQHSEQHPTSHLGLSVKDPPPSRSTSVTLSDMPANSPFALAAPLPMTSSLHTSSALPMSPPHPISHNLPHSHLQSQHHRHHLSHTHTHAHAHAHTHTPHSHLQHLPLISSHMVQTSPPPPPAAIPAPTHALHPTILQDLRDFTMRGPPANSSPVHYFDFPPEDDISMSGANVGTRRSSSSGGGPSHGTRYQQGHSHEQQENDYSFYQFLESSFPVEYPPQPRSPFSAVNFGVGMSGASVPVLDASYHQLVEQLGFHS